MYKVFHKVIGGYNMKSSELKGFLTGLLIGDGSIDKGVTKRAFSIKSVDKSFIDKIETEIKSCTNFKYVVKHTPEHFSCGCNHKESWEFRILAHPYFNKIYHKFYNDYRHRIISKFIPKYMTPYGVAMWYCSDGYICLVGRTKGIIRSRRVDIATDRYSKTEVENLSKMMLNKFGIKCSVIRRGSLYRLRVVKDSYEDFINLIFPYVVPSMYYKLYLGYEQKPIWMSDEGWNLQCFILSAITQTGNAVG